MHYPLSSGVDDCSSDDERAQKSSVDDFKDEQPLLPSLQDVALHTDVKPRNWRDLAGFWICGLINNFGKESIFSTKVLIQFSVYVVMLSAAHDLVGDDISPAGTYFKSCSL